MQSLHMEVYATLNILVIENGSLTDTFCQILRLIHSGFMNKSPPFLSPLRAFISWSHEVKGTGLQSIMGEGYI